MLVAYLDFLGFRDHLSESLNDALLALGYYAEIMEIKTKEIGWVPEEQELQVFARSHGVDTFDYFLPFSDSIVIASSQNPNIFIRQIASFLCSVFKFNSESFDSTRMQMEGRDNPLEEVNSKFGCGADGHLTTDPEKNHNYPMLFRGGVSYGDVGFLTLQSRIKEVLQPATILAGQAVVNAVKLEERKIKGPRILFDKEVFSRLSAKTKSEFCRKVPEESHSIYYELLWPNAYCLNLNSSPDFGEIDDLYGKAVALWRHYNHEECGIHYFKFSELIIASAMEGAEVSGQHTEVQEHLRELVKRYNLSGKYNAL